MKNEKLLTREFVCRQIKAEEEPGKKIFFNYAEGHGGEATASAATERKKYD